MEGRRLVDRAELIDAFWSYVADACEATRIGAPERWARHFDDDCWYREPFGGEHRGKEAVCAWLAAQAGRFPQTELVDFPVLWTVFDEARSAIGFGCLNVLSDPGDRQVRQAPVWARLLYSGAGRFRAEENLFDTSAYLAMLESWLAARRSPAQPGSPAPARSSTPEPVRGSDPERTASSPAAHGAVDVAALERTVATCAAAGPPGPTWAHDSTLEGLGLVVVDQDRLAGSGPAALARLSSLPDDGSWPQAATWQLVDPVQGAALLAWRRQPDRPEGIEERWALLRLAGTDGPRLDVLTNTVRPAPAGRRRT